MYCNTLETRAGPRNAYNSRYVLLLLSKRYYRCTLIEFYSSIVVCVMYLVVRINTIIIVIRNEALYLGEDSYV